MKEVQVCNCNPDSHHRIVSTDTRLIRSVRKNSLEQAARCEAEGDNLTAVYAEYTAYLYLVRLRELKSERVAS